MEENNNYLKITNAIIELVKIMDLPSRYYKKEEYQRKIDALDEYFRYNTEGFDHFVFDYKDFSTKYYDIKTGIYFINPEEIENPYIMWMNDDLNSINYTLKSNTNIKELQDHNQGVVSFSVKTGKDLIFKKKYVGNCGLIKEEYIPNETIVADLYDPETLLKTYHDNSFETYTLKPANAFVFDSFWAHRYLYQHILVTELEPNKYEIYVTDCDYRPEDTIIVEGESMYSAYYRYMVEKGYFKENRENNKKHNK